MVLLSCWRVATRRRRNEETNGLDTNGLDNTNLKVFRRLSKRHHLSASAVGLSGALGVGIWVVCTEVTRAAAGPAALVSFVLAVITSILTGLCYMEFLSRLKGSGSAFAFVYYSVGEFPAFIVGWTLIMDYTIGAAAAARSFSHHLDFFFDGLLSRFFKESVPIGVGSFAEYFDLLAFATILLLGCFTLVTVRSTVIVSAILTGLGLLSVVIIIIVGAIEADTNNWQMSVNNETISCSPIFPYCCIGTFRGAIPALYMLAAAVGFLGHSPDGSESRASVKGGSIAVLTMCVLCTGVIAVVSLSQPHHLLNPATPLSELLNLSKWSILGIIINFGGILLLLLSTIPAIHLASRILSDMAREKLVPCFLTRSCSQRSQVSAQAKMISVAISACFAGLFDLHSLLSMFSVGFILAYLCCSAGIIILRYEKLQVPCASLLPCKKSNEFCGGFLHVMKFRKATGSTSFTAALVNVTTAIYFLSSVVVAVCVLHMSIKETLTVVLLSVSSTVCVISILMILLQPTRAYSGSRFMVPLVPLLPCFNILLLVFLAVTLDAIAWIRFGIWLAIGVPIYLICLYCYNRGTKNMEVIDKKVQNNGHIKGNLNRAFSTSSENKISIGSLNSKANGGSSLPQPITTPTYSGSQSNGENILKPRTSNMLKDQDLIVSEEDLLQTLKMDDSKTTSYLVMSSPPVPMKAQEKANDNEEISIIEMFDQMLATVEAPPENGDKNDDIIATSVRKIDIEDLDDEIDNTSDKIPDDTSFQNIVEYNVVAMVHREDKRSSAATDVIDNKSISSQSINDNEFEAVERNNINTYSISYDNEPQADAQETEIIKEEGNSLESVEPVIIIPTPPPMDDDYFSKLSYRSTIPFKKHTPINVEYAKEISMDIRRQSTVSDENYNPLSGSEKKNNFMNHLNTLLQNQVMSQAEPPITKPRRSLSSDHIDDISSPNRSPLMDSLHAELLASRRKETEDVAAAKDDLDDDTENEPEVIKRRRSSDAVLSREQIKSKLELLFSANSNMLQGPKRVAKSADVSAPTEEKTEDDTSNSRISSSDMKKLENLTKLDTLQLQRAKFSDVLNSFRLSQVVRDSDGEVSDLTAAKTDVNSESNDHNTNLF